MLVTTIYCHAKKIMSTITCTQDGLHINGHPFYLLSGQIHYFRWPRAEWRDLLLTAKAGGLNTIDTVIPWNLHEPQSGQFNFDGLADLAGFIDLCAELGLYFIARPGPYICAEWENGGLPAWLGANPEIGYRFDHPLYLEATLRWFDRLLPLIIERQFDRGGPIILVQIENEHWASGRYGHDAHQTTLAQALQKQGVTVPLYTCVGAGKPWPEFRNGWTGIANKLVKTRQAWADAPLIVSELWSGWFDDWGNSAHNGKTAAELDQCLHELTAIGTTGFSHWMWAGGTNFAYWGGRTVGDDTIHMTTSYDYNAPISEYNGLTEKYYVARRHHLFLTTVGTTIAPCLAHGNLGGPRLISPKAIAGRAKGGGKPLRQVQQNDFTATYLQNNTLNRQTYQLYLTPKVFDSDKSYLKGLSMPRHLAIEVEAMSIKPVFTNLPLANSGLTLQHHTGRILGFWQWADRDVLVLYGFAGEQGEVQIAGNNWQVSDQQFTNCTLQLDDELLRLTYWVSDRPVVAQAMTEGRLLQLVILNQARAERCWPVPEQGLMIGPDYVIPEDSKNTIRITTHGITPFYWVGADGQPTLVDVTSKPANALQHSLSLTHWESLSVAELHDNDKWQPLEHPQPFEALDCLLGYGWYWAVVERKDLQGFKNLEGLTLTAPALSDRGHLYFDGEYVGTFGVSHTGPTLTLPVGLTTGQHEIRLLVDNLGRFNYGNGLGERKGLLDTLYVGGKQTDLTQGWVAMWQEAYFAGEALANAKPEHLRPDAEQVDLANFAYSGSDVWFLRRFTVPIGQRALLYFLGDRNPGALFVNGQTVARFSRHYGGGFHKYDVTDYLSSDGDNVVTLYIRDYAGLAWRGWLLTYDENQALPGQWSFRPGITPKLEITNEKLQTKTEPRFWRCKFEYQPEIDGHGPFKLSLVGLVKGQIWLNGHNVGRYWQVGPQEFYKIPVSWLQAENELLVFEESNGQPDEIRLWVDELGARTMAMVAV